MPKAKENTKPVSEKKEKKENFYQAVGRRKESTARVRLVVSASELTLDGKTYKKGDVVINGKPAEEYFRGSLYKALYTKPFQLTDTVGRFITTVKVEGGGPQGQLGAILHGIARSLEQIDKEKYRPVLKSAGFITRDPRKKQRRKAGFAQKARAKKQSPKR